MNVLKEVIYNYKEFWGGVLSTIFTSALIYLFRNLINKIREKQIHINIREKSVVDYTIVKKMSDCSPWEMVGYCFVCMSKYLIDSFGLIVFFQCVDKIFLVSEMEFFVKQNDRAYVIIGILCLMCCLSAIGTQTMRDRKWFQSKILKKKLLFWWGMFFEGIVLLWSYIHKTSLFVEIILIGGAIFFYVFLDTIIIYGGIYKKYQNKWMSMGRIAKYIIIMLGALIFICAHQWIVEKVFVKVLAGIWYIVLLIEYLCNIFQIISPVEYKVFCDGNVYKTCEAIVQLKDKKIKFVAEGGNIYIFDIEQIEKIEYEILKVNSKSISSRAVYVKYRKLLHKNLNNIYDDYWYVGADWIEFKCKQGNEIKKAILKCKDIENIVSRKI